MILIFFSWIVMLFFFIPSGILLKCIFKIETYNFAIIAFFGMFMQTLLLSIGCFFINIGFEIFIINLIFVSLLFYFKNKELKFILNNFFNKLKSLSFLSKIIFLIISVLSLYKSASLPFLIDNESYYIQTIKWINGFGYVQGLANLHIFLAQMSPLHILQAGFNFSFLIDNFNDINGLLLIITSYYFIEQSEKYYNINRRFHWIGLFPIFNILFLQFVGQPSPDLIIVLLSQIIFYLFVEKFRSSSALKIGIILFLFIVFVKLTIAPLGLLIVYWIYKRKQDYNLFLILGLIITIIFILKNSIISGYPLYPFDSYSLNVDWKIPDNLYNFITESTKNTGYFESQNVLNSTFLQKINSWLHLPGLNRIFNLGIIILFILTLFTNNYKKNINLKILYFFLLIHFVTLLCTSPQYRFFLPEFIFFAVVIICTCINFLKINFKLGQLLIILFMIISFFIIDNLDFSKLTGNQLLQQKSEFNYKNLFIPASNSKYDLIEFKKIKNENLQYYSPKDNFFFYGTANGQLPCVNKVQVDYLEKYYFIIPQMRTNILEDGFYSKILQPTNE